MEWGAASPPAWRMPERRFTRPADLSQTHVSRLPSGESRAIIRSGVFQRIRVEKRRLDILVNSAWGGYERMVEDGRFTWPARFWDQPLWRWEAMVGIGVCAAFVASQHAARLMLPARIQLSEAGRCWWRPRLPASIVSGTPTAAFRDH